MLTADRRLMGQSAMGPKAVADQSKAATRPPISPPPVRNAGTNGTPLAGRYRPILLNMLVAGKKPHPRAVDVLVQGNPVIVVPTNSTVTTADAVSTLPPDGHYLE